MSKQLAVKEEQISFLLKRGVAEVIERSHLEVSLRSGKKLRVKLGIDPTAPFLHLGNAAVLRKLRQFQDLGHQAVLIVGDFTAMIGDPSDRPEARPPLTEQEVKRNMKNYLAEAGKIIDVKKTEIYHNSHWFLKEGGRLITELARMASVQQVLRREDFQKRIAAGREITLLETLYPVFQGYDSVKVKADVEIGATEQKFNLLMGRQAQKHFGMPEQDIMTLEILIGTDGAKKMSKTSGNFIKISEPAETQFAQLMSLKDELMPQYFKLLTDVSELEIGELEKALKTSSGDPKKSKMKMAFEIVKYYNGEKAAAAARDNFESVFREKKPPRKMAEFEVKAEMSLKDVLVKSGLAASGSEAQRLAEQRAVSLDGQVLTDWRQKISLKEPAALKVGKFKFIKLKPRS